VINRNFIFLLILLAVMFWQWWIPGEKAAQDLPYISISSLKSLFNPPFVWSEYGSEGLGQYSVFTLWSWPLNLISGFLANIGLNFTAVSRFYLTAGFLLLGSFSIWKFTKYLGLTPPAQFIASLFYLANTYILLVLDGGQLSITIVYALIPTVFIYLDKALIGSLKDKIIAGLGVYLVSVCDIRFVYLLAILILIRSFFRWNGFKSLALTGGIISLILIGLHFYWLYPLLKSPLASGVYAGFTESSVNASLINIGHSLTLLAPHWYQNTFGVITPLRVEFFLIPMLVFLAAILRRRDGRVAFWLLVAIISVFLSKGSADPLGIVYTWAYNYLPGFSLFRDSTKFLLLVALSYSVLIGISVDELLRRFKSIPYMRFILPLILTVVFVAFINPVWLGKMRGTFSHLPFQSDQQTMLRTLETDKKFSRILWIPSLPPLGYFSPTHPSIEASRIYNRRPFVSGVLGTYEKYNFLREASYSGQLLDVAGVAYLIYPALDPRQPNLNSDSKRYYQIFLNQLRSLPWIISSDSSNQIPLLQTKAHQDRFFLTDKSWIIIGSDDIYQKSTLNPQAKLSTNALIFAEERPELIQQIINKSEVKIVLNNKTATDLAASLIPSINLIFPAQYLTSEPNNSGWWKRNSSDYLFWRDFLKVKYNLDNQDFDLGGGWAVGEGQLEFSISNSQFSKRDILLARVMESSRSGELNFLQEGQLIGRVDTKNDNTNMRWKEVGKLNNSSTLEVRSSGDINVINALAVLDSNLWGNFLKQANSLEQRVRTYPSSDEQNLETVPQVTYQIINPTKFKVSINGLLSPKMLVFSQTYDPRWHIDQQQAVPIYSFLNGFWVEKDGEYLIEFAPQKYLDLGLIISGLTALIILVTLKKIKS